VKYVWNVKEVMEGIYRGIYDVGCKCAMVHGEVLCNMQLTDRV
jgi:hypothetical protein